MMKRLFAGGVLLLSALIFGLGGCIGGIGNKTEQTRVNYAQTVIYDTNGNPIQVLSDDGVTYVSVNEASNELLVKRGLIRIDGVVRRQ